MFTILLLLVEIGTILYKASKRFTKKKKKKKRTDVIEFLIKGYIR